MIKDKTFLYFKEDIVTNAKANVVIVHGIAEHLHRYDYVVSKLNEAGYNVFRYDQRGHGRTQGKKGYVKSLEILLEDLQDIINYAREKKNLKVFVLGHSLGGGITNIYASTIGDIDGYISSGAATDVMKQLNLLKIIPYQLLRWVRIKNNIAKDSLATIKEVEEDYLNDPYVLKSYKIGVLGEVIMKGSKILKKNYDNIKMPVLIMHGKLDPTVPQEFSVNLYQKVASTDKELVIWEESLHEIYNDLEKDKVINKTIEWLDNHA